MKIKFSVADISQNFITILWYIMNRTVHEYITKNNRNRVLILYLIKHFSEYKTITGKIKTAITKNFKLIDDTIADRNKITAGKMASNGIRLAPCNHGTLRRSCILLSRLFMIDDGTLLQQMILNNNICFKRKISTS